MLTTTSRLPAFVATLTLLLLPACGGSEPAEKRGDQPSQTQLAKAGKGDDGKSAPVWPDEPIDLGAGALTGAEKLPVDVALDLDGKSVKLGDLLAGNSLVVYIDTDAADRQNRAATRFLRDLARSAGPVGFRLVLIFPQGTAPQEVDGFYEKRKIRKSGRAAIDTSGAFAAATGWGVRSAALVAQDGSIADRFTPSTGWDARLGFEGGLSADLLFKAWAAKHQPPQLDAASKDAALTIVRGVLAGPPAAAGVVAALPADLPAGLGQPISAPVYVNLYRIGEVRRLRGTASEGTFAEAIAAAAVDALSSAGDTAAAWQAAAADVRFAIDLAAVPTALPTKELRSLWFLVEPGIDGLVLKKGDATGVVLPHEPVTQGFLTPRVRGRDGKFEAIVAEAAKRANVGAREWRSDSVELQRFRTASFGTATTGALTATDFFRGNVLMDGPPDEARVLESLRIGGQWLVNTVMPDGKFDYEYFPNLDKGSSGYNIVRHAGSVYGLFEMYELAKREPALAADAPRYIDAASRAMGYIYDAIEVPKGDETGTRRCLIDTGRCESGSAALTLLTFLVRPKKEDLPAAYRDTVYRDGDDTIILGLALTLTDMIDADGRVWAMYSEAKTQPKVKKEPLYYPGESMLALLQLHAATGDARWLEGARKIGTRQADDYDQDRFMFPDHWVMQAYAPLWKATKEQRFADTAYAMATHSVTEQYPTAWTPFPDYHGAWRRKDDLPRTTRAGSRLEALRGVLHLAWAAGQEATVWEESLLAGADHLIEKQHRADNSWYLPNPPKSFGAYPMGVVDNHERIDNNQHALVGLVGALEILRRRSEQ